MEPSSYSYQETGCWVSEAVGQNWWVSFTMMTLNAFQQSVDIGVLSKVASVACWRWCCSLRCPFMSFISQHRYLQTSALLAGDVNLTTAERKHFCQELLNFSGKSGDKCKWWTLTVHNLKWEKKNSLHFIVHYQSVMLRSLCHVLVCHKSYHFYFHFSVWWCMMSSCLFIKSSQ